MTNHFSFATLFLLLWKKNCIFLPCYSCWHHFPALNFKKGSVYPSWWSAIMQLSEWICLFWRSVWWSQYCFCISIIVILTLSLFPCAHVSVSISQLFQNLSKADGSHLLATSCLSSMHDKHWNHVRLKASIPHHTSIDFIANKPGRLSDSSSSVIANAIHTLSQIILHNRLLTKRFGYTLRLSNNTTIYILY